METPPITGLPPIVPGVVRDADRRGNRRAFEEALEKHRQRRDRDQESDQPAKAGKPPVRHAKQPPLPPLEHHVDVFA
ncbi:MAG: hypothetical protein H6836_02420 [Planctomycetes bacterium]|nr:hypothetical protein [Planctomycetota bacterium]MCB9888404.1 hypothetical protein [Planctomycetota bacterium]